VAITDTVPAEGSRLNMAALAPPLTAIEALLLFDERLGALALAGVASLLARRPL
jgi:hypothetical protein